MKAPLPANEEQRLAALREYAVLDTAPESEFDELVALAAQICEAPIAVITLIDERRQWFKSRMGLSVAETSRDVAFCAHAILQSDLLIVPDALQDKRFADNPLVTSDPNIRFYAGAPLITPEGYALGTLCVLDREPRELKPEQQQALRVLSHKVMSQLELRRQGIALARATNRADQAEEVNIAPTRMSRSVAIGFWVALLILMGVIGVTAQNLFELRVLTTQRTQVRNLLLASKDLFDALQDAEIGQRGFLLTGDEHYLEPYLPVHTEVDRHLREIERLTALSGVPPYNLQTLRPKIIDKLTEMDASLQAYRKFGKAEALRIVNSGHGKQTMDNIRTDIATQENAIVNAINVRVALADTRGLWAMRWLVLGGGLSVLMILITFFWLRLEIHRRLQAALALRLARESVEKEVRGRTAELVQANTTLRDSEAYIRQIGDYLPGGFIFQVLVEPDGRHRLLHISAGVMRINGVSPQQALEDIGILYRQYVDDDRARCAAVLAEAERTFSEYRMEVRMRRPDGEVRWCLQTAAPHRLPDGRLLWNGIELDVTERKQAEVALRDSEARLRLAAESSNTGLWDWDLRSNEVYFSPIWKRQIGYEDHEIANRFDEWQSRVHPDDIEAALAKVNAYIAAPSPNFESEFRLRHKDGSYRWILAKGSMLHNGQDKPVRMLGSHLDITERKQVEEKLAAQLAELLRWQQITVGRETRVQQLKEEINRLLASQGQAPRYPGPILPSKMAVTAPDAEGGHE
jgi:PAS domain S-box-containing protein